MVIVVAAEVVARSDIASSWNCQEEQNKILFHLPLLYYYYYIKIIERSFKMETLESGFSGKLDMSLPQNFLGKRSWSIVSQILFWKTFFLYECAKVWPILWNIIIFVAIGSLKIKPEYPLHMWHKHYQLQHATYWILLLTVSTLFFFSFNESLKDMYFQQTITLKSVNTVKGKLTI